MASKIRKPQARKQFTPVKWDGERVRQSQELRRSNAAGIHKGQGEYQRRPKHVGRGWDD